MMKNNLKFCSLYSGSSGNALYIGNENQAILIDAGESGTAIIKAIESIGEDPTKVIGILVTHEHQDHIRGVGIISRKLDVPIYANQGTWDGMRKSLGKLKEESIKVVGKVFEVGDFKVKAFDIPHDARQPVGYNVYYEDKKITIATDIGIMDDNLLANFMESDFILLESNHDEAMVQCGPYPYPLKRRILGQNGHLSNTMASDVVVELAKSGTKKIMLGHLSGENNYPELAYLTAKNKLDELEISDVSLEVAKRRETGRVISI